MRIRDNLSSVHKRTTGAVGTVCNARTQADKNAAVKAKKALPKVNASVGRYVNANAARSTPTVLKKTVTAAAKKSGTDVKVKPVADIKTQNAQRMPWDTPNAASISEALKAFNAKRLDPIRGTTIVGARAFGVSRPANVYADMILQNGSALERPPLRGFPSDAWSGGWDGKNFTDFADEFLGRGDRSDESTVGSVLGAFTHGVVFDFAVGTLEAARDLLVGANNAVISLATHPIKT
jgi:hypothetical protein